MQYHNHRHDTKYHQCELADDPDEFLSTFIDAGMCVHVRRMLKRLTMISPRHPYTKLYANSIQKLRFEQKRHLIHHYEMFHPFSMFIFYSNIIFALTFMGTYIIGPPIYAFFHDKEPYMLFLPKNMIHLALIVISFNTGYYSTSTNTVIMNRKQVIFKYLGTYFFVDVAGVLPYLFDVFLPHSIWYEEKKTYELSMTVLTLVFHIRYFYCLEVFNQVRLATGLTSYVYKLLKLLLHVLMCIILMMYVTYTFATVVEVEEVNIFRVAERVMEMVFLVSYGDTDVTGLTSIIFPILVIMFGFILHLLILIQFMKLWYNFFSTGNQQTLVYNSIGAFMQYKALPVRMRERIWLYLDFKYHGHFYKDTIIERATSSNLRKEILLKASLNSTEKVDLFHKLPENLMKKLRACMVSEIYLPGDIIIKAGQTGTCMFFILAGTVKITSPQDRLICYLKDGSHFGEVALVINIARVANVIAETPCELLRLNKHYFLEVLRKYPSLMTEMREMAATRMTTTNLESPVKENTAKVIIDSDPEDKEFEIIGERNKHLSREQEIL